MDLMLIKLLVDEIYFLSLNIIGAHYYIIYCSVSICSYLG
jgi:hypothetical protein